MLTIDLVNFAVILFSLCSLGHKNNEIKMALTLSTSLIVFSVIEELTAKITNLNYSGNTHTSLAGAVKIKLIQCNSTA